MLANARRTVLVLGLVLPSTGSDQPPRIALEAHSFVGFTAAQRDTIDWALALFDEAELALPSIDFIHHTTVAPCRGGRGLFTAEPHSAVVHICTHEGGAVPELLIVHEIAHAWDSHALSERRRNAFLEWRGLTDWWGASEDFDRWTEYGSEQAAEVIVWGLMDRPIRATQIPPPFNDCAHLREGYTRLVGTPPLHGYTERCAKQS